MDKLEQANKLKADLKDIDLFLFTINPQWDVQRGSGSYDIDVLLKTENQKSFKLFGTRWFGCGTHKSEIRIPNILLVNLYASVVKMRTEIQRQFDELVPNNKQSD